MIINVPLDYISDNRFQCRQDYGDVEGLAADIAANGLLQIPIGRLLDADGETVVMPHNLPAFSITDLFELRGCRVELAFGHRRKRAWAHLDARGGGWTLMPVDVRPLDDDQMLNHVWSENQRRSDINAIEQAELLAEKLERARAAGGSQATVAAEWGLDRSTIANKLRLLELPDEVQTAVRERRLSERQALALLGVAGLAQRLNGSSDVRWGDTGGAGWLPRSPGGYIAHVVAEPDGVTSDAIRDYVKTASRHAGVELPDLVATTPVDGDVIQDTCKGCPRRYDQYCLYRPCLDNKLNAIAAGIAQAAAEEVGLPYSGDPRHFEWFGPWDRNKEIKSLHAAGITENLVVGYAPDAGGAGLFRDHWVSDGWAGDGRALVVLGHRLGKPTEDERRRLLAAVMGQATDKPARPLTQVWEKAGKNVLRLREHRARQAIRARLEDGISDSRIPRLLHTLFATPRDRGAEGITMIDAMRVMWEMARARPDDPAEWAAFLAAAGLDPTATEARDEATRLRELVTEAANGFYQYDSEWRRKQYASHVIEACAALDAYALSLDEDIAVMADWLRRALPEAQRIVAEREANSDVDREPGELEAIEREEATNG